MDLETARQIEDKRIDIDRVVESHTAKPSKRVEGLSYRDRFYRVGARMTAMCTGSENIMDGDQYAGYILKGSVLLQDDKSHSIHILMKARESYTPGSLRPKQLDLLEVVWVSSVTSDSTPLVTERLNLDELSSDHPEDSDSARALALIEESVTVAGEQWSLDNLARAMQAPQ